MDFQPLEPMDVVSYKGGGRLMNSQTFTVAEFAEQVRSSMGKSYQTHDPWFAEGMPCRILRAGSGWQKGRVRVSLEFYPDDSVEIDE